MPNPFFTDIKILKKAIESKKLVVFAGAGVSIDSGVPLWSTLINEMQADVELPPNENDALRIAQIYYNDRDAKEYLDKVRSILKHKRTHFNAIHEAIFGLSPEHIVTTNYDDHFEQIIRKRALPFSVISKDEHFPFALNTNLLVKMHGDLDDTDIVLKEDDYLDFSLKHPLIEGYIKSIFATKVVLFLGYSFSDVNLKYILHHVRSILGKNFQQAYLITLDDMHPTQRFYLRQKGIKVVSYTDANFDGNSLIEDYLQGNNYLGKKLLEQQNGLSERGQKLYNFLQFLAHYNCFMETLKKKKIVDKLYHSLKRFEDIPALPPQFIAYLYPFRFGKHRTRLLHSHEMVIGNPDVVQLFFHQIERLQDGRLIIKDNDVTHSLGGKENDQKLSFIQEKLNYALIYFLISSDGQQNSIDEKSYVDIRSSHSRECDCLQCNFKRLSFDKVLHNKKDQEVSETSSLLHDRKLAYTEYKLGNFVRSYLTYELIAHKAWQEAHYIIYFLAKISMKNLRNLVARDSSFSQAYRDKIVEAIDHIDLDAMLTQLTEIDDDQHLLLTRIKSDYYPKQYINEINSVIIKINEEHNFYVNRKGFSSGHDYGSQLQISWLRLEMFIRHNQIPFDVYNDFIQIAEQTIEALIIDYQTRKLVNRQEKVSFNRNFIDIAVFYLKPSKLLELLKKYNLQELPVGEETSRHLIEISINYLKSNHEVGRYFDFVFDNTHVAEQLQNGYFGKQYKRIFSMLLLILSRMTIHSPDVKELIKPLFNFIDRNAALDEDNLKFLGEFLRHRAGWLSPADINLLLQLSLSRHVFSYTGDFLSSMITGIKAGNLVGFKIEDQELSEALILRASLLELTDLWDIVDDQTKQKIADKIQRSLDINFDYDAYYLSAFKKIIDYRNSFPTYLSAVRETQGSGHYTLLKEGIDVTPTYFRELIQLIRHLAITLTPNELELLRPMSDYERFLLDPSNFDLSKFDPNWLLIDHTVELIQDKREILPWIAEALYEYLKRHPESPLNKVYFKHYAHLL